MRRTGRSSSGRASRPCAPLRVFPVVLAAAIALATAGVCSTAAAERVPILFDCVDEAGNQLPGRASLYFENEPGSWDLPTPFTLSAEEGDAVYVTFTCYGRSVMMGKHVVPDVTVILVATGLPQTNHREGGEVVPGMMCMIAMFRPLSVSVVGMDPNGADVSLSASVQVGGNPAVTGSTPYEVTACNGAVLSVTWEKKRPAGPYNFILQQDTSFICDFTGNRNQWTQTVVDSPGTQAIVLVVPTKSGPGSSPKGGGSGKEHGPKKKH